MKEIRLWFWTWIATKSCKINTFSNKQADKLIEILDIWDEDDGTE